MKNKRFWIIVASVLVLSVILACTLPISIVVPTEEQQTVPLPPTAVLPPAVPPTAVPPTAAPASPTLVAAPVDWSGAWVVWMGGSLQQFNIDFVPKDNQITGNAAIGGGHSIAFFGLISADKRMVTGNWESTDGRTGVFTWHILDTYVQFNGNKGGSEQICGARSATARPAICLAQ